MSTQMIAQSFTKKLVSTPKESKMITGSPENADFPASKANYRQICDLPHSL
jgi:hypothetical protein